MQSTLSLAPAPAVAGADALSPRRRPLRVVHVVQTLDPGGLERLVVDLVRRADRALVEPSVVCIDGLGRPGTSLAPLVGATSIDARPGVDLAALGRLVRVFRRLRPHVVHSHNQRAQLFATLAARIARVPVAINTQHGLLPPPTRRAAIRRRLLGALSDAIVAVSDADRASALAIDTPDPAKVRTILNGTDIDAPRLERDEARRLLGLPGGALVVGAVGRLAPEKDHEGLIEAVALARRAVPDLRLAVVGGGPLEERLRALVAARGLGGAVTLAGYRPDGAALLPAFDVFSQPSRREGIALAVLEAMAAGLPIVATRVGGNAEAVGDAGVLVPPASPAALAEALVALAGDPGRRAALGSAARARAAERFSFEATARAYSGLYAALVGPDRGGAPAGRPRPRLHADEASGGDVLYHFRTRGTGAEGVHARGVIRALRGLGRRVSVVAPPGVDAERTAGASPYAAGSSRAAWRALALAMPPWAYDLAALAYNAFAFVRLQRALRATPRPDWVYERYAPFLFGGALAARRARRPLVLEVNESLRLRNLRRHALSSIARRIERWTFRRADALLCVTPKLAEAAVAQGADPRRVHVIPNAIEEERFAGAGARREEIRARYGIAPDDLVVVFVGWFVPWHGLDVLVRALERLAARGLRARLLLVGEGPLRPELEALARALGVESSVAFAGAVPFGDVPAHIAAADVAAIPSTSAFNSPIKLFECLAAGCAVVAPALPQIREVVEDGRDALLVEPGSVDAMAGAIERLAADPGLRSALGATGRAKVLSRHTWRRNAERIAAIAGQALAERRRPTRGRTERPS